MNNYLAGRKKRTKLHIPEVNGVDQIDVFKITLAIECLDSGILWNGFFLLHFVACYISGCNRTLRSVSSHDDDAS